MLEALVAHLQPLQVGQELEVEDCSLLFAAALVAHDQFFELRVKELAMRIDNTALRNLLVTHPHSLEHRVAVAVIQHTSSPALAFANPAFVLHLLDVRIVAPAITHIHLFESESLVHFLTLTVIQHAPTIGLIIQHIAFPSLSIVTQIQHPLVFDPTHLLSIHPHHLLCLHVHLDHSLPAHLHQHRRLRLRHSLMIPPYIVVIERELRVLQLLLLNLLVDIPALLPVRELQ